MLAVSLTALPFLRRAIPQRRIGHNVSAILAMPRLDGVSGKTEAGEKVFWVKHSLDESLHDQIRRRFRKGTSKRNLLLCGSGFYGAVREAGKTRGIAQA